MPDPLRRRVVAALGAVAAGAALPGCRTLPVSGSTAGLVELRPAPGEEPVERVAPTEPGPVLIVGAGAAGLGAALALRSERVEVQILEARDRIGGRMLTKQVGGSPLDEGAAWNI